MKRRKRSSNRQPNPDAGSSPGSSAPSPFAARRALRFTVICAVAVVAGYALHMRLLSAIPANSMPSYHLNHPYLNMDFHDRLITLHMTPDSFVSISHRRRAEILAAQTSAILDYAQMITGYRDVALLAASIKPDGPNRLKVRENPSEELKSAFSSNYQFSSNIRLTASQERFIAKMTGNLSVDTAVVYDRDEFIQKMSGFSAADFYRRDLGDGGIRHTRYALMTRDIARAAVMGDSLSATATVERLMDWTFINVSNHFVRAEPGRDLFFDYNEIPVELMIRGMGDCDRSAWVFARLARHRGLDAHVVYLHRPGMEGQNSFHTIAQVRTEEGWKAVDPFNNVMYPRSIIELAADSEYFQRSWVFPNVADPFAFLPVMKVSEMAARVYVPDQILFVDIRDKVSRYIKEEFSGRTAPERVEFILSKMNESYSIELFHSKVSLTRWEIPFWLRGYYYQNAFRAYKNRKLPYLQPIRPARIAQVLGQYESARASFLRLGKRTDTDSRFYEERDYYEVLNEYYLRNYPAVESGARNFFEKYPKSPRCLMLKYVMAHSLKEMNRRDEAVAIYPTETNFQGRGKAQITGMN